MTRYTTLTTTHFMSSQGQYQALAGANKADVTTDTGAAGGNFRIEDVQAANYKWAATLADGECKDSITSTNILFPMSIKVPAVGATAVTATALMTVPAGADAAVADMYKGQGDAVSAVPAFLWKHVYGLLGYDDTAMNVSSTAWLYTYGFL